MDLSNILEVSHENKSLECSLEFILKNESYILGIDEAGRGPVLGPMVYACAFYPEKFKDDLHNHEFADSKELSESKREELFEKIYNMPDKIGWCAEILSPTFISNSMLKRSKYNLNLLSHDTAIRLINKVLNFNVCISQIYVDTVGLPEKYEKKLQDLFPHIKIKVSKKADSIYPVVSAASICAKVIRDYCIKNWKFPEKIDFKNNDEYGSGYPGDPKTKSFLINSFDKIFGFSNFIRFSWSTAKNILDKDGIACDWENLDEEETNQPIKDFFQKNKNNSIKISRNKFFINRFIKRIESFE